MMHESWARSDNAILFFLEFILWKKILGLDYLEHREEWLQFERDTHIGPAYFVRSPGHEKRDYNGRYPLRESWDNLVARAVGLRLFNEMDRLHEHLRDLNIHGWQLKNPDGSHSFEGNMAKHTEIIVNVAAGNAVSITDFFYYCGHLLHFKIKPTFNMEFMRMNAIEMNYNKASNMVYLKSVANMVYRNVNWAKYAVGYHGENSPISKLILFNGV